MFAAVVLLAVFKRVREACEVHTELEKFQNLKKCQSYFI